MNPQNKMNPTAAPFSPPAGGGNNNNNANAGGGGYNNAGGGRGFGGNNFSPNSNNQYGGRGDGGYNNNMNYNQQGPNAGGYGGGGGSNYGNPNNNINFPPHQRGGQPPHFSGGAGGGGAGHHRPHVGNQMGAFGGGNNNFGNNNNMMPSQHGGGMMGNQQQGRGGGLLSPTGNNPNMGGGPNSNFGGGNNNVGYNPNNNYSGGGYGSNNNMQQQQLLPPQGTSNAPSPSAPAAPAGPPVLLLFDAYAAEREAIASTLANEHNYAHIVTDDTETESTLHYKKLRERLREHNASKADPAYNRRGVVIEVKLAYHFAEMYYLFEELRNAKVFPTHIVYVDHPTLADIPQSEHYDMEQRTHHPLHFETCSQLFQSADQFQIIDEKFAMDTASRSKCEAMSSLLTFLDTPKQPLRKIDAEPYGIFKFISLHPDVNLLTGMTDRLVEVLSSSDLYAKPSYQLDYANFTRNSFQLPNFSSTIDMYGIDVVIAKIDGQYLVFFPKYIALGILKPEQVPEALVQMGSGAAGTTDGAAITSPTNSTANATGSPEAKGEISWVINATICADEDAGSCTIYAKDILMANGIVVAAQSFQSRHKLLIDLIPEQPVGAVIIVRQRYYKALETDNIFRKIDGAAGSIPTTAGNGLWFINPGKAQLLPSSHWNFKYALPEGGFDARLWNSNQAESQGPWTFEIHTLQDADGECVEEPIGTVTISNERVEADALNDGNIARFLVRREMPDKEPPAPKPKGGRGAPKAAAPQLQEPKIVFEYLARQPWTFEPTNDDPTAKRFPKKDLLEALAALK